MGVEAQKAQADSESIWQAMARIRKFDFLHCTTLAGGKESYVVEEVIRSNSWDYPLLRIRVFGAEKPFPMLVTMREECLVGIKANHIVGTLWWITHVEVLSNPTARP